MFEPVSHERSDESLMLGIANRDESAFELLYDRYAPLVYPMLRRILHSEADAQAVISDVFWEIWEKHDRYNPERGSPRNYILMVARSRGLDRVRSGLARAQRERRAGDERQEDWEVHQLAENPLEVAIRDEDRQLAVAALEELTETQRQLLELAYFGGLSHRQISEQLAIPLGSVKTGIRRGLQTLRRILCSPVSLRSER